MAIEKTTSIFQHQLDKLVEVYENSAELTAMLIKHELYIEDVTVGVPNPERILQYEQILTVFVENSEEISDSTITELLYVSDIRDQVDAIIIQAPGPIEDEMYRQFLYTFKYGTIKSFFLLNAHDFMPAYDVQVMHNQDKLRLWQQAFMRQFDRFAETIDNIIEIQDIDTISEDYLEYIAQLVGFERGDTSLGDALFREITKNIIEVYRIKGTNYSFELFFNFIGFEIDVIEYYFDSRFYLSNLSVNPYTKETSKYKFAYYLTPNDPTNSYPDGMSNPFVVMGNQMVPVRNGLTFDEEMKVHDIDKLEKYLGIIPFEDGDEDNPDYKINLDETYTYFKSNVVEYSISTFSSSADEDVQTSLTEEDLITIQSYTTFLTPIFVSSKVIINITPFEDDASLVLNYKDESYKIDDVLTSMFILSLTGEILAKVGMVDGVEDEYWEWQQDNMDRLVNFIQSKEFDDMNPITTQLIDDGQVPIDEHSISYPYIENKPNIDIDFTITSSTDLLTSRDDNPFCGDYVNMSIRSTDYHANGGGITFGENGAITYSYYVPIDGVYVSGTVVLDGIGLTMPVSGGADTSGSSENTLTSISTVDGGAYTSGSSENTLTSISTVDGGFSIPSSDVNSNLTISRLMDDGAYLSGDADTSKSW